MQDSVEETHEQVELARHNVSLFELSSEDNLKVNIINDDHQMVNHYKRKLANKKMQTVKYFDIDITDDLNDINDALCKPIGLNDEDHEEDYVEFKVKKFMSSCGEDSYARKILLNDMDITVKCVPGGDTPTGMVEHSQDDEIN
ncbi:conserved Plasmodium protein, unknown function [Plasmodium knowlesi strain H]|uniref:Uncharacterized protein n=3 Tax=Plasmodium knowlesi TaxID=5850 RepID=A0A5K1URW9_PLAKH|nr:conserved Plasmodium protein, unknown function [Plasmodium knowlesi strain H]OTN67082.1 Uncharacterized protein PKNOH_S07446300 [Plasmodium knowlesi]CAA9988590.1 conserved Plasmodium protein, unknown function [Plasmodium knowlesi strain H]SBO21409.1 conserved Plasmodium protein, unknown function [Plasmodium knowlesi strain H]SBO21863.1 conserved Plasmodium protein, unknown function [Plasmodium knowlesi strain H]VVS78064.1 conserved Plasmodium protein, unknown function [Plasmodium knowlesi s|eukprot:XP_002259566.1 hypothetical protein, conserved in Plasmodium species [Plasmodium knowlesi strain H]